VPLLARDRMLGTIAFVRAEAGRPYGPEDLALAEDLARRAAQAVDNARLYREAQEAVRARNELFSLVSHDLKNPLAVIKSQAQLIKRRASRAGVPETDHMLEGLASIDARVNKMTALIDELLDMARLQIGQPLELDRQPTDLVALAHQVADVYQRATESHQIVIEAAAPELVGHWDAVRLERVLGNLLANAIKYTPDGGRITLSVTWEEAADGDWAVLAVQDQGVGIPSGDLPRIFERFFRAGNVAGQIQGAGLGLASARQVVEQHGGTITVDSQEGVGSTFSVRLPL
jgi:signal transduction histidine kinase